tara:strand:- start:486 stop:1172 length:687 start_codon:yes stop_codon:yes gene_type:complete
MTQSPSFHQMFLEEISVEQDILNATTNAQRPWAVKTFQLNYTPGLDSYAISVTDFGKPLLVSRVVYSPYINRINVPFDDLNGQHWGTVFQAFNNTYGMPWNLEDTPERFSFYRENVVNSSYNVKIQPQPQQSAVYEILYAPGFIGDQDPLEATIQLPEHAELVRLRCAIGLLPYCKWSEDVGADTAKKQELRQVFEYKLNVKEPAFSRYISSITTPKDTFCGDWNNWG